MIELCDGIADGRYNLGVGVPEDAAHLARREVEHLASVAAVNARAFGPLDDEVGKIATVTENMVGHWAIARKIELGAKSGDSWKYRDSILN
jgi:hypothetical protein